MTLLTSKAAILAKEINDSIKPGKKLSMAEIVKEVKAVRSKNSNLR